MAPGDVLRHRVQLGQQRGDHRAGHDWPATPASAPSRIDQPGARDLGRGHAAAAGQRLHELVDVVIDNGGVVGDAAVEIDGLCRPGSRPRRRSSARRSSNALVAEVVERLVAPRHRAGGVSSAATSRAATPPTTASSAAGPRRDGLAVRRPGRHRGLLRPPLDPRAAPRPHRVPRRPGHEHLRLRTQGRPAACGATGARRTTATRSTACGELVERCRGARAWRFLYCISPGLVDPLLGRCGPGGPRRKLRERRGARRRRTSGCCSTTSRASCSTPRTGRRSSDLADGPRRRSPTACSRDLGPGKRPDASARPSTGAPAPSPTSPRSAQGIDPRIDLFWTGRAICSPTLDLADAATFARSTNRPPTYWDNYPVNDVAMGYELHIGPYRGRDPHLWRASTGSSPTAWSCSSRPRSRSRPSPTTCATPRATTRRRAGERAIRDVVGDADLEAFALFADNVRSSCLAADDAPIVGAALWRRCCSGSTRARAPRRGRGPRRARGPAARAPRTTCCAARSRTARSSRRCGRGSRRSSWARRPSAPWPTWPPTDRLASDGAEPSCGRSWFGCVGHASACSATRWR